MNDFWKIWKVRKYRLLQIIFLTENQLHLPHTQINIQRIRHPRVGRNSAIHIRNLLALVSAQIKQRMRAPVSAQCSFFVFFSPRIPAQWIFLLFSWHLCRLKFLSFFLFMFFQFAFFVLSFSLAFFLLSLRFFFSFVFRVFSFSSSRLYLFPSLFFYLSLFLSFSLSLFLSFSFSLFRSFSLSLFLSSSLPLFLSSSLPLFLSSSFSFSFCLKTWHYVQHPLVLVLAVAAALRDCFSQVWMWSCGISRLEFPTAKKRNSGLCGREQCLR